MINFENITVNFKVVSSVDESIWEQGILETQDADCERPIKWLDYGLKWYFPNNPFDPDFQVGQYNRHYRLREAVENDDLLIDCLVECAEEDTVRERPGYYLIINNGELND